MDSPSPQAAPAVSRDAGFSVSTFVDNLSPKLREAAEEIWSAICEGCDLERTLKEAEAFQRAGLIADLFGTTRTYEFYPTRDLEAIARECRFRRLARYASENTELSAAKRADQCLGSALTEPSKETI